jgi:UDP-glucose:(heptosyl)LPS alpha-1,3-glucosyltransferase
MRLAIVRQRYTPYGGAERFVERALDALARGGVELALVTRRWPRDGDRRVTPIIVDPPYLGRTWRDKGFARAVCATLARMPATLVQSHERIECCDIYRAGDGVHAVWFEERIRDAAAWTRSAIELDPYHRYVLEAERRLYASPRLRQVICNSRMVQNEIHERFGLQRERLPIIYNAIEPPHSTWPLSIGTCARDTASPTTRACSCRAGLRAVWVAWERQPPSRRHGLYRRRS